MVTIELEQAEQDFRELFLRVESGESFTLARHGRPFGTLQPVSQPQTDRFRIGALEGRGVVPDDIKGPYEAEINEMFYGK